MKHHHLFIVIIVVLAGLALFFYTQEAHTPAEPHKNAPTTVEDKNEMLQQDGKGPAIFLESDAE
ncbi:MAG: hypothetical protein COU33_00920 [Candidatus Magasanikbacteria bacterium CG10_big_fil_rev_8_21_14_0_10_43_6]|uniref:Uncharacterized protein n=1 Tax=Candidatus Magasanikbacteria bacterium CG10_big_fil_rev_8_21_14_0_10_43_6 TaxID=1974650 RepID=A0A2M6W221_9BACT|nr:MAG: hypothetical protein COU33_00920 [Candidatus Magasanikbacteria bacterium CG10_big_fil_rev_8_21_14_0_10_43_6]